MAAPAAHACAATHSTFPPAATPHCSAAPKKLCAATFSADGAYAIAADKFGDVLVASTRPGEQQPPPLATADAAAASGAPSGIAAATPAAASGAQQVMQKPSLLLGHLCSIITSLTATPDGHFLVSTDKESKVRVSIMPPQPLQVRVSAEHI